MSRKKHSQPPSYWFSILLDSLRDGDFVTADHADRRLKDLGIEVSLRRLIPDEESSELEAAR